MDCNGKELKIRGLNGIESIYKEDDEIFFVDDDRWSFCQRVGMHLGYFWCLSELNELTKECTQNCRGVGVTTKDPARTTSGNVCGNQNNGIVNGFQRQENRRE